MDSSTVLKREINWHATCGKECGRQYPGKYFLDTQKIRRELGCRKFYDDEQEIYCWQANPKATRENVDKLRRPYIELRPLDKRTYYKYPFYDPYAAEPEEREKAWNLPIDHKHHISQFPAEIMERILFHCLVVEHVTPRCVSRNCYDEAQLPYYSAVPEYHLYRVSKGLVKNKDTGECVEETRKIWKRSIDATVLRVCKSFHEQGRKLLYGENTFVFKLDDLRLYQGAMYKGVIWHDTASDHTSSQWHRRIPKESLLEDDEIQMQVSRFWKKQDQYPVDWIFTDPFLRFLRTIGPVNASLIKNLEFSGDTCKSNFEDGTDLSVTSFYRAYPKFNLQYYLRLYGMFIERHCPNLQFLRLGISFVGIQGAHVPGDIDPLRHCVLNMDLEMVKRYLNRLEKLDRAAFRSLLQDLIPKLKNLRELKINSRHYEVDVAIQWRRKDPRKNLRRFEAFLKVFYEWIHEADEDMAGDIVNEVARAFKERSKHPELVAFNAQLRARKSTSQRESTSQPESTTQGKAASQGKDVSQENDASQDRLLLGESLILKEIGKERRDRVLVESVLN